MTLTLTVVRHGDTFAPGEAPRRIGAATDLPLVASGERQADALGRLFAQNRFDRVLASPLRRTQQTAARILAAQSARPAIEDCGWLAEIDHGPDENRSEADVIARIGAAALDRWNKALVPPPGWHVDAEARIAAWAALMAEARGHWLLVTSAGAARFALAADPALAAQVIGAAKLRTGAWGRIEVTDGAATLTAWNRRPGEPA